LFGAVTITQRDDGLVIEAPPEAARRTERITSTHGMLKKRS
jgi:hypothetical protein